LPLKQSLWPLGYRAAPSLDVLITQSGETLTAEIFVLG